MWLRFQIKINEIWLECKNQNHFIIKTHFLRFSNGAFYNRAKA